MIEPNQRGPEAVMSWYDFLCPYCYVGQHRTAILIRHGLQVVELPFQIHPEIPPGGIPAPPRGGPRYDLLEREAAAAGLPLRWPLRLPDTRRALSAAEWSRRHQPHVFPQLHRDLLAAHFVLGEDLEDPEVTDRYAKRAGADLSALHAALDGGSAGEAVARAEALGREHGVESTPAWLVGRRLITGLRPAAEFEWLAESAKRGASR